MQIAPPPVLSPTSTRLSDIRMMHEGNSNLSTKFILERGVPLVHTSTSSTMHSENVSPTYASAASTFMSATKNSPSSWRNSINSHSISSYSTASPANPFISDRTMTFRVEPTTHCSTSTTTSPYLSPYQSTSTLTSLVSLAHDKSVMPSPMHAKSYYNTTPSYFEHSHSQSSHPYYHYQQQHQQYQQHHHRQPSHSPSSASYLNPYPPSSYPMAQLSTQTHLRSSHSHQHAYLSYGAPAPHYPSNINMITPGPVSHHEPIRRHDGMHRHRIAANTRPAYFTWTSNGHRWHSEKSHVFRACVNCRKGHVACDVNRPCRRCILGGKADTCIDVDHRRRGRRRAEEETTTKCDSKSTTPTAQSGITTPTDKEVRSTSHSPRSQAISPRIKPINHTATTTNTSKSTSNSTSCSSNNSSSNSDTNSGPFVVTTSGIPANSRFQPYSINKRRASLAAITTVTRTATGLLANSRCLSTAQVSSQWLASVPEETSNQMISNQQRHSVEPASTDSIQTNRSEFEMTNSKETPVSTNYSESSYSHDGIADDGAVLHHQTDTNTQSSSTNRTDVTLPPLHQHHPHRPRTLSPPSPNASHMASMNDAEMNPYTQHAPVELPPLMDGPPMPARHKLPAILSSSTTPSSKLSEPFGGNIDPSSDPRPSLPPLSSLTTGLSTSGSSPASLSSASMSHNMPPNSASLSSIASTPPHVPLTPSHSGGRDYFPPVPNASTNSITAVNNTASQSNSALSMLSTMVIILTFMDLRVVRVSDESLNMLGHHPMLFANKSLSELLHRTDRPKLAVLREWLRWVVCSASGLSDVHLTRFPGNVTSPVFQRSPTELTVPAQDWPSHIIIEDNVHFRVLDGEYRQFRIRFYVGGPGVRVGHAETWENACVICEVRRHTTPTDGSLTTDTTATNTTPEEPTGLPDSSMNQHHQHHNNSNNNSTSNHPTSTDTM